VATASYKLMKWKISLDANSAQTSITTNVLKNSKKRISSSTLDKNGCVHDVSTATYVEDIFSFEEILPQKTTQKLLLNFLLE